METWYCKTLGDGAGASAPSLRIQQLFPPLYAASGQPPSMAVFARHDRKANRVTAFFSPRATELAALFGASPCAKPSSDGIGLLVGNARSWELFFPDRKRRAAQVEELKARALRYLVRREHSRDELARKLAPYAESNEILEGTLNWLESTNKLSNQRFAEVRAHILARKYGAAKIRQDLKEKGVEAELVDRVSVESELTRARAILQRKYRSPATTREERTRRARFLHGRGFSYDTIRALGLSGSTNFSEE